MGLHPAELRFLAKAIALDPEEGFEMLLLDDGPFLLRLSERIGKGTLRAAERAWERASKQVLDVDEIRALVEVFDILNRWYEERRG